MEKEMSDETSRIEISLEEENKRLQVRADFLKQQITARDAVIDQLHKVVKCSGSLMMSARIVEGLKGSLITLNNDKELELAKNIKEAVALEMGVKVVDKRVGKELEAR